MFQNPYSSLNPRRPVGDSVARPLAIAKVPAADARRKVGEMLERVSLTAAYADRYPDQLSGGERQRVAIARALVSQPDVLVCDEVTSALDVLVQAAVVELLAELQRDLGLSMLFVTHNLPLVRSIAHRVAVMADGQIVEIGSTEQVLTDPAAGVHQATARRHPADPRARRVMAATPDFDTYPPGPAVTTARNAERWVEVGWADGHVGRFHHVWLRDNCACPQCVHQITKEQMFELVSSPSTTRRCPSPSAAPESWRSSGRPTVTAAATTRRGCAPTATTTHDSTPMARSRCGTRRRRGCHRRSTDRRCCPTTTPCWNGSTALRSFGLTRLRDVPVDLDEVGRVAGRVGIVRETNFGVLWDVRSEPDPITNANTALSLPPHVDLATREYQPGLQFLHCIENTAHGGQGTYLDGFRVAEILRDEQPEHFEVLTTVPWRWANRSKVSDYRWASTPIVLDPHGVVTEVRVGNWLRAPLDAEFDRVEAAYAAYRALFDVTLRDDLTVRVVVGARRPARLRQPAHPPRARRLRRGHRRALPPRLLRRARRAAVDDPHPRAPAPGAPKVPALMSRKADPPGIRAGIVPHGFWAGIVPESGTKPAQIRLPPSTPKLGAAGLSHSQIGCRTRDRGRPSRPTVAPVHQTMRWAMATNAGATVSRSVMTRRWGSRPRAPSRRDRGRTATRDR